MADIEFMWLVDWASWTTIRMIFERTGSIQRAYPTIRRILKDRLLWAIRKSTQKQKRGDCNQTSHKKFANSEDCWLASSKGLSSTTSSGGQNSRTRRRKLLPPKVKGPRESGSQGGEHASGTNKARSRQKPPGWSSSVLDQVGSLQNKVVQQSAWTQHEGAPTRYSARRLPSPLNLINERHFVDQVMINNPLRHSDHCVLISSDFFCYRGRNPETQTWI
ncbi:hypothetical protein CLF_107960 [Clonorchis sinensis]|uniref:Uncharacterized protein n=1 Tax=Clonorchis sinensis TaxID=79923 RepID=G7YR65_CLOSI|nr:hypothetical protein CLF_107960 [Clonorchis sinensis]